MFAMKLKTKVLAGLAVLAMYHGASHAQDTEAWYQSGTIPVTVTLTDVQPVSAISDDVIYVSIQTRETYRSMKGYGGILKVLTPGTMEATFNVSEPGEYAVSIWHDRDADMRFSMNPATYAVTDGWGASGTPPTDRMPSFDDVKVTVPPQGLSTEIAMINPA